MKALQRIAVYFQKLLIHRNLYVCCLVITITAPTSTLSPNFFPLFPHSHSLKWTHSFLQHFPLTPSPTPSSYFFHPNPIPSPIVTHFSHLLPFPIPNPFPHTPLTPPSHFYCTFLQPTPPLPCICFSFNPFSYLFFLPPIYSSRSNTYPGFLSSCLSTPLTPNLSHTYFPHPLTLANTSLSLDKHYY